MPPGATEIPTAANGRAMLVRLAWGLGKFTVKNILIPIAITAATAVLLEKLADRVAPKEPNGVAGDRGDRASMAM